MVEVPIRYMSPVMDTTGDGREDKDEELGVKVHSILILPSFSLFPTREISNNSGDQFGLYPSAFLYSTCRI